MKKSLGPQTLIFPTPVWCVGSYDDAGKPNVMTIAWGGICCSSPPCVTISLRKTRYTSENIMARKAYTISVPSEKYVKVADYFGIVSGRNEDKFQKTNLTAMKSDLVDAPYVGEFPLVLECQLLHHFELGQHTQFVGEIIDVKVDEETLGNDGKPDMRKVSPIIYSTKTQRYHGVGKHLGNAFEIGREV